MSSTFGQTYKKTLEKLKKVFLTEGEAFALAGNVLGIFQQDPALFLAQEQQRKAQKLTITEAEIARLIKERDEARNKKNWKQADEIRDQLASQGIILEDTPEGTTWRAQ